MQLFSSWTGSDFLLFYIMLLGLAALAAWWIPFHLRPVGRRCGSLDAEDIAVLAGGTGGHTDSVIADLYARGAIINYGDGKLRVIQTDTSAGPSGHVLLAAQTPFKRAAAERLLAAQASRIAARMRREGLLLQADELNRLRWMSIAPFAVLFMIGLYRQRAGSALGEPTEFLLVLLVLTAGLAVFRFTKFDQRTVCGIETITRLREQSSRLRRAPRPGEAAMAVALFGTGVLVGTPWEPVHAMRQQGSGDGSGGGDSSSDGGGDGSGCGGGGCGGCGG